MGMSPSERRYIDGVLQKLSDAVVELRDATVELEARFIALEGAVHQEIVALKHKNGLK